MTSEEADRDLDRGKQATLLIGACGAAAIMVLPDYLMTLQARTGRRIRVVMTHTASRILPAATVRLVSEEVFCDGRDNFSPGHVGLASWADQLIVLPATAHMLGQAAHGLAGNLLGSTLLAYERSVMFFPSMNLRMWRQPSVQRNVEQLRSDGHCVVEPVMKSCWEVASATFKVGPGLPAPEVLAQLIDDPGHDQGSRAVSRTQERPVASEDRTGQLSGHGA